MKRIGRRELVFQVVLHLVLFIFFCLERKTEFSISLSKGVYFFTYAVIAGIINYHLLPRYLYCKNYKVFIIGIILLLLLAIGMEELVLEQIFYPDTRGQKFPGFIFTLIEILPLLTIFTGFKFAWDANEKNKELLELKETVKEDELKYLRSQINPHFLFNHLNNIYSFAVEESKKTPDIILRLASVLRYMLYDCKADKVPLYKEIGHLQDYITLNELTIEGRGKVAYQIPMVDDGLFIAPLILNVFVENAFKHSSNSQSEDIDIRINLILVDDVLTFECSNSFLLSSNDQGLNKGIGLDNVRKRLDIIYPNKHALSIESKERLFNVRLRIDLKKEL